MGTEESSTNETESTRYLHKNDGSFTPLKYHIEHLTPNGSYTKI